MWVSRHPLNNSLAVFIHGIWGSRWTTWRSYVDFFQRLPTDRPELRNYDVYLFTYDTRLFGQEPPLLEIVRELRTFLAQHEEHYDTIVFVCHSQGGLLAKIYIVEELQEGRGTAMKVDLIITLNTPHRGADWRNPFILFALAFSSLINAIPVVRRLHLLRQLADLSPWSSNIRLLIEHWNSCISVTPGTATAQCRYIQSIAICGLRDGLVSRKSAAGFYSDRPDATFNAHPIDSPKLADYIGHLLGRYEPPSLLNRELEEIYATPHLRSAHEANCVQSASSVLNGQGDFPASYVSARAHGFAHEFKSAFARHPLRKLSLENAFVRYVRKVLAD